MSMSPDYQQIVELFGLVVPEIDVDLELEESEQQGRDGQESQQLGNQSLREGEYQRAIKHYQRALHQSEGDPAEAHLGLATAFEILEQSPAAVRQYARVLKLQQDNPDPYIGLSEIYKGYGHAKEAIQRLEEAVKVDPANPHTHFKLAETLRECGYPKKALRAIQQAVLLAPDSGFFHYWMGDLQVQLKDYEAALISLRAAIELSPGDDFLYSKASVAFWGAGKPAEAIKAVRLASDLAPDSTMYFGLMYAYQRALGNSAETEEERKRAEKMDDYDRDRVNRFLAEAGIGESNHLA
ncbi:MAG: tetratricopeptide repeat protein [Chthonomonas sp.]|nr:tetratricopeptide repeat protein [Chthonomonas sp.]